jgi:hypothetical protein
MGINAIINSSNVASAYLVDGGKALEVKFPTIGKKRFTLPETLDEKRHHVKISGQSKGKASFNAEKGTIYVTFIKKDYDKDYLQQDINYILKLDYD